MRKKIVTILVTTALASTVLAGCGKELKVAGSDEASTEVSTEVSTEAATEDVSIEDTEDVVDDDVYVPVPDDQLEVNPDPYQIVADSNISQDEAVTLRISAVDGMNITANRLVVAEFDENAVLTAETGSTITSSNGIEYTVVPVSALADAIGVDMSAYINSHAVNPDILVDMNGQYAYFYDWNGTVVLYTVPVGDTAVFDVVEEDAAYTLADDAEVTVLNNDLNTLNVDAKDFASVSWEDGYLTSAEYMLVKANVNDHTITKLAQIYEP